MAEVTKEQTKFDRILRGGDGFSEGLISQVRTIGRDTKQRDVERKEWREKVDCKLDDLSKAVAPLAVQSKIIVWVGAGVGISVMGLIWAIITHQVTLVFP